MRHQRIRSNEAIVPNHRAVQNRRAHPDQRLVSDRAGVDNRRVANRHVVADEAGQIVGQMHHGVVLNVRVAADDDAVDVAAQDGVVPDAGALANFNIAHDDRALRNIDLPAELRPFQQMRPQARGDVVHE